jgi:hypothetical protein
MAEMNKNDKRNNTDREEERKIEKQWIRIDSMRIRIWIQLCISAQIQIRIKGESQCGSMRIRIQILVRL